MLDTLTKGEHGPREGSSRRRRVRRRGAPDGRGVGQEGNRRDPARVQRGGPRGAAGTAHAWLPDAARVG